MPKIITRTELLANDNERAIHLNNRSSALQRLEEVEAEIADLQRNISANAMDLDQAANQIASGNFDVKLAGDVSSLKLKLTQLEGVETALRRGIDKIDEAVVLRDRAIDADFLVSVAKQQRESLIDVFDSLLTIAEVDGMDNQIKEGAEPHLALRIPSVGFRFWSMQGGPTGSHPGTNANGAKKYLESLAKVYEASVGFRLNAKQASRLSALSN